MKSRSKSRSRTRSRSRSRSPRENRMRNPGRRPGPGDYFAPPHHQPSYYYPPPPHHHNSHFSRRFNPSPCRCLGVFGLDYNTSERTLHRAFDKYGRVDRIKLVTDPRTGKSRGFAFIYFDRVEDAEMAKERLHGTDLDGSAIRVEYSISSREHQATPGVYMGGGPPPPPPPPPHHRRGGYGGGYDGPRGGHYDGPRGSRYYDDYYDDYYNQPPPPPHIPPPASSKHRSRSRSRSYERRMIF